VGKAKDFEGKTKEIKYKYMENKCKNCQHWKLPQEQEYFGAEYLATPEDVEGYCIKDEDIQRSLYGHATKYCRSPKLKFHQRPSKSGACVADGSQYLAVLITGEDFGCVNWEKK
jgi:hypothetical protein